MSANTIAHKYLDTVDGSCWTQKPTKPVYRKDTNGTRTRLFT